MDPKRRRSFDSVDPTFDEEFPEAKDYSKTKKPEKFITAWAPVMERNGRW